MIEFRDLNRRHSPTARITLGVILFIALAIRVIYIFQIRSSPYFNHPAMDALYHVEWAKAIYEGRTFQEGPFFRAPLYPLFLAAIFKIFGVNLLVPRLLQALLGTVTTLLCYLIGRDAYDRRVGFLSAFLVSIYWVLIYFDGELLIPALFVPLLVLSLWLSLRLREKSDPWSTVFAGIAWGLAAIARPNVLLFMPFLVLWFFFIHNVSRKRIFLKILIFVMGLFFPIAPVTVYNYFIGGDTILISSQAGVNFWIGNNPSSDGTTAIVPGTRSDWWGGYHDAVNLAETAEGHKLKPSEISRFYSNKAWKFIIGQPHLSLRHFGWKFRLFWTDWELGNNQQIRFMAHRFGPITRWLPIRFSFLAAMGTLGFILTLQKRWLLFPLWGFLIVYMISVLLFFVSARYRVPILPVLAIFSAYACLQLVVIVRNKRYWALCGILVLLLFVIFSTRALPPEIDTTDALGLQTLAIFESQQGNNDKALKHFKEAVTVQPRHSVIRRNLGLLLTSMGRFKEGEKHLSEALRINPQDFEAWSALSESYLEQNRLTEALEAAKKAISIAPTFSRGYYILGRIHLKLGYYAEAEKHFKKFREYNSSY